VDGGSGALVEPNNAAALAAGIAALYRADRAGMGRHATQRAHGDYEWSSVLPLLMSRYSALLTTRQRETSHVEPACAAD
jgi:glycosyltransferase involved in cell wall biosynthesis